VVIEVDENEDFSARVQEGDSGFSTLILVGFPIGLDKISETAESMRDPIVCICNPEIIERTESYQLVAVENCLYNYATFWMNNPDGNIFEKDLGTRLKIFISFLQLSIRNTEGVKSYLRE